ncbi:hypothetical protein [Pseudomonas cannabina]|uniref:hypothetical protein n=1 Tax=Pseudomonas cannabina TaxID=86840 RepID=UPI0011C3A3C5|nr:hypothetical protein [Pseudomonas cannabina]
MPQQNTSRFPGPLLAGAGAGLALGLLAIAFFGYHYSKAPDEVPTQPASLLPQELYPPSQPAVSMAGAAQGVSPAASTDGELAKPSITRCRTATDEQATLLLKRLFPDSKMLSFEPLALDAMKSLCLLEVEMLADKANAATKGFVYVLPDGERFLNGPLMDKRSQVSVQSTDIQAEIEKARAQQKEVVEEARKSLTKASEPVPALANEYQPADAPTPTQSPVTNSAPKPDKAKEQAKRAQFLKTLEDLPAIVSGNGKFDVYVMFDPQCVHCHRLYAQHPTLVSKHNLRFHWIPIFMNDGSWVMSAFLLKTAQSTPEVAKTLLAGMMDKSWDPKLLPEDAAAINSMSPQDYELPRKATIAFFEATKENKALGTPVVAFKAPNGTTEIISGEPYESDWSIFDKSPSQENP